MPEYVYRAMTKRGVVVRNRVEDVSKQILIQKLKKSDLLPISITQVGYTSKNKVRQQKRNITDIDDVMRSANASNVFQGKAKANLTTKEKFNLALSKTERVRPEDIRTFTQNFYLLKKANFNNIHALSTIIQSTDNMSFRGILEDILAGVEAGEYMYTTMEYYGDIFPYIYINMIKVGELSGSLTNSLEQAERYLEEANNVTKKVKGILVPNIIQFCAIFLLLIVGTVFAVPAVQNIFDSMGSNAQLPGITIWFSNFLNMVAAYWYIPTLIIVAIGVGIYLYITTPKGRYNFHYFKYTMPIFGKLIYLVDLSRFMKAMLLNLQNGMRIQDALDVSKNVIKNYVMLSMIETAINNTLIGASWIEPFERSGLTSPMVLEMLKIGMQTDLPEMMDKLVDFIESDIDNTIQKIVKILPEFSYAFVGAVLIFFVLVVLVPCIQVYMGGFVLDSDHTAGL